MAGGLLLSGCAATNADTQTPEPITASASQKNEAIEQVREANPDHLGEGLVYKQPGKNAQGEYVILGADPDSSLASYEAPKWAAVGEAWSEREMAQLQVQAVDFVYSQILSGPALGGSQADIDRQVEQMSAQFSKLAQGEGAKQTLATVFAQPIKQNPFLVWSDAKANNFSGYQPYQDAGSSRMLNPMVKIKSAHSYDKGEVLEDGNTAEINGATVNVVARFEWKLTKDGKRYAKPMELEYGVHFSKTEQDTGLHGATLVNGATDAKPKPARFKSAWK